MGPLNLAPKYAKMLANGRLDAISVIFRSGGITVRGRLPSQEGVTEEVWMDLPEAIAATAASTVRPWAEERTYKVQKFEQRLDIECPANLRDAASEEAWNAAMAAIPFERRKAFNMSNKDFEREYVRFVNGVGERRPVEDVIARESVQRGSANRGRGRGGRGRGSSFQAQIAQN